MRLDGLWRATPTVVVAGRQPRTRSRRMWAQVLGFAGLLFAIWGYVNDYYARSRWPALFVDSLWVSRYSEILVIAVFGAWRVRVEKNAYTRRRIATLVVLVSLIWGGIPLLWRLVEPGVGDMPFAADFPGVHVPGALTWFVWLGLIFLFGRRVDCAWCCPCVGIRETAGAPFRAATPRGGRAWALRHVKWIFAALHVIYFALLFFPGPFAHAFFAAFWLVIPLAYYASFLIVPLTGSRNYCRYVCPFGAVYGLVGRAGFFRIEAQPELCLDCGKCDRECDMGVPVSRLVREKGVINVSDCTGCARCVAGCPRGVLTVRDVRDVLRGGSPPSPPTPPRCPRTGSAAGTTR